MIQRLRQLVSLTLFAHLVLAALGYADDMKIYVADQAAEPLAAPLLKYRKIHGKAAHRLDKVAELTRQFVAEGADLIELDIEPHTTPDFFNAGPKVSAAALEVMRANAPHDVELAIWCSDNFFSEDLVAGWKEAGVDKLATCIMVQCFIGKENSNHIWLTLFKLRQLAKIKRAFPDLPVIACIDTNYWQGNPTKEIPSKWIEVRLEYCRDAGLDALLCQFKRDQGVQWFYPGSQPERAILNVQGESYLKWPEVLETPRADAEELPEPVGTDAEKFLEWQRTGEGENPLKKGE